MRDKTCKRKIIHSGKAIKGEVWREVYGRFRFQTSRPQSLYSSALKGNFVICEVNFAKHIFSENPANFLPNSCLVFLGGPYKPYAIIDQHAFDATVGELQKGTPL